MRHLLLAMGGGALGAGARYLVNIGVAQSLGSRAAPLATLGVNVIGSFLMGLVIGVLAQRLGGTDDLRIFLATGILGGFTTFSAFSLDVVTLSEQSTGLALAYALASVVLSVLALLAGLFLVRG